MKAVRDDAAFCGTASLSALHFIRLCYGRGEGRVMMNRRLTLVPYGERMVPLPGIGTEPNYNTMCPNCDRVLPWHWEDDGEGTDYMQFEGAVEIRGQMWCNEACELLSRLDLRQFFLDRIRDAMTIGVPQVAGMYAKKLATFARAFEEAAEAMGGRI